MRIFMVLIAAAVVIRISLIGQLSMADVILCLSSPLIFSKKTKFTQELKLFYILSSLWLIGAVVTDLYRGSDFTDFSRGWAMIIVFILNFTAVIALCGRKKERIIILIIGFFVAISVGRFFGLVTAEAGEDISGTAWKMGYGHAFTMLALIVSAYLERNQATRTLGIAVPFVVSAVNMVLNARSLAGITGLVAIANSMVGRSGRSVNKIKLAVTLVACIGAAFAISGIYRNLASSGALGEKALEKYELRNEGDLNMIQAGRAEYLASVPAVIDSPILGHGSWAKDYYYVALMMNKLEEAGIYIDMGDSEAIPTHSHLMGSWVQHGIFGGIFWIWAIYICLRACYAVLTRPTPLASFTLFIGLNMIWDVLFSPFGMDRRVLDAAYLYYLILVITESRLPAAAGHQSREVRRRPVPVGHWRPSRLPPSS